MVGSGKARSTIPSSSSTPAPVSGETGTMGKNVPCAMAVRRSASSDSVSMLSPSR